MSNAVRSLEPNIVWNHFADLNAVPRASKKEEKVREFMVAFGNNLGLSTEVDAVGNVIIRKPASPGMDDRTTVVLQSHLDMVHQKNRDTQFDFDTEGIKMIVDGDWVKAEGTTLGADNGLGVASIMALLSSNEFKHPPLEALFTIDEETGMTGAMGLQGGVLSGKILLNLDTEDDDELTIGCAGGVDVNITGNLATQPLPSGHLAYQLHIRGLQGGHSGMDIHLGRGNANKIMNRIIWSCKGMGLALASIDGGGLRNAIPRESIATVTIPEDHANAFREVVASLASTIKAEHSSTDPDLQIDLEPADTPNSILTNAAQLDLLRAIYACPNGIYRMSPDVEGLVQTSNNLARVELADGALTVQCLTRSSVNSEKMDEAEAIRACFEAIGATVVFAGSYPGWTPKPSAAIVKIMEAQYKDLFGEAAHVSACHAGLECGILGTNYPDMEMISFGPNIRGAHSPDEKAQISSFQKFWRLLLHTLALIPKA